MSIKKPVPQRRCINYRKIEAPVFYEMETKLCEKLGCTYSELHKKAVRKLSNDYIVATHLNNSPALVY